MWSKQTTLGTKNTDLFLIKSKLFWLRFVEDQQENTNGKFKGMDLHRQKSLTKMHVATWISKVSKGLCHDGQANLGKSNHFRLRLKASWTVFNQWYKFECLRLYPKLFVLISRHLCHFENNRTSAQLAKPNRTVTFRLHVFAGYSLLLKAHFRLSLISINTHSTFGQSKWVDNWGGSSFESADYCPLLDPAATARC